MRVEVPVDTPSVGRAAGGEPQSYISERAEGGEGSEIGVDAVVEVLGLVKVYPGGTRAVDGIDVSVKRGEFFGFLGPNGAGKTTTIRILATLVSPTSGQARVAGLDVVDQAAAVRRRVGFAMQTVAVDLLSTGRENLELIGRLHRMRGHDLRVRVDELLELMGLTDVAGKLAGTYSGGMKRRLDLASALVHRPEVLFLDEPTEGLDPQSRTTLWEELERVNRAGTTMFLTTHYMEEADRLCDRLAIIDHGVIAASGSPEALKREIGADRVTLRLDATNPASVSDAQRTVEAAMVGFEPVVGFEPTSDGLILSVVDAESAIPTLLRKLEDTPVKVRGLAMEKPSLDDVFLHFTGRRIRAEDADRPLDLGWYPG
jgi:daunorubicin resistance ABC transporter ATP-binding subunit